MKVLKSGIEIDPKELKRIKGGMCSCCCDVGIYSMNVCVPGDTRDICICGCYEPQEYQTLITSAARYL